MVCCKALIAERQIQAAWLGTGDCAPGAGLTFLGSECEELRGWPYALKSWKRVPKQVKMRAFVGVCSESDR